MKYDTVEQLQAMLIQMNPKTRYPVNIDDPSGTIYPVRLWKDFDNRPSAEIVESQWKYGTIFSSHEIADRSTLVCYPQVTLGFSADAIKGLSWDATNLEEKYQSKKPLPGDDNIFTNTRFPSAVVIGSEREDWYVSSIQGGFQPHVYSTPVLKRLASDCQTEEEFAVKLTTINLQELLQREWDSLEAKKHCDD